MRFKRTMLQIICSAKRTEERLSVALLMRCTMGKKKQKKTKREQTETGKKILRMEARTRVAVMEAVRCDHMTA